MFFFPMRYFFNKLFYKGCVHVFARSVIIRDLYYFYFSISFSREIPPKRLKDRKGKKQEDESTEKMRSLGTEHLTITPLHRYVLLLRLIIQQTPGTQDIDFPKA